MQDLKMEIMWKDDVSAIATVTDDKVNVVYYTDDPTLYFLPKIPLDTYMLMHFLETRCYPRNRKNIDDILKHFGLSTYDPLAICRLTHGIMRNDHLWLRFDNEPLTYQDVKIRED